MAQVGELAVKAAHLEQAVQELEKRAEVLPELLFTVNHLSSDMLDQQSKMEILTRDIQKFAIYAKVWAMVGSIGGSIIGSLCMLLLKSYLGN